MPFVLSLFNLKKNYGRGYKNLILETHWIIMMLDERTLVKNYSELFWCIFLIIVLLNAVVMHACKQILIH